MAFEAPVIYILCWAL